MTLTSPGNHRRQEKEETPSASTFGRTASAISLAVAVLGGAWLIDLLLLRTPVLSTFNGQPSLTPIYGFWVPILHPHLVSFAALAAVFLAFAGRMCDPKRTSKRLFAFFLVTASVLLALALFSVRQEPAELGTQFQVYPGEEFIYDAQKIEDLSVFVRDYVSMMPDLSLHGRHFPPGHATLLYLGGKIAPGPMVTGAIVLTAFGFGLFFAYLAMTQVVSDTSARQGCFLLLACPSVLDFSCTSMDAVFLCYASLALWLGAAYRGPQQEVGEKYGLEGAGEFRMAEVGGSSDVSFRLICKLIVVVWVKNPPKTGLKRPSELHHPFLRYKLLARTSHQSSTMVSRCSILSAKGECDAHHKTGPPNCHLSGHRSTHR